MRNSNTSDIELQFEELAACISNRSTDQLRCVKIKINAMIRKKSLKAVAI